MDPTGMYVCNGTKSQCAAIEAARQADLKSKNSGVVRAANAFGSLSKKAGDAGDNGVNVTVTKEKDTKLGEVQAQAGTPGFTVSDGKARQATDVQINANSDLKQAVAHEGTHMADRGDYVSTINPTTWKGDAALDITHYESEVRAFTAQNAVVRDEITAATLANAAAGGGVALGGKQLQEIDIQNTLSNPPYSDKPYLYLPIF